MFGLELGVTSQLPTGSFISASASVVYTDVCICYVLTRQALREWHNRGYVNGDIKPANVVVEAAHGGNLKSKPTRNWSWPWQAYFIDVAGASSRVDCHGSHDSWTQQVGQSCIQGGGGGCRAFGNPLNLRLPSARV